MSCVAEDRYLSSLSLSLSLSFFLSFCFLSVLSFFLSFFLYFFLSFFSFVLSFFLLPFFLFSLFLSFFSLFLSFKRIFKWIFERFSKICEKPFKHVFFMKKCFKNEMFLGQIIAKPSFLNYFFAKNEFHCRFTVSGPTARRSSSRSSRNKDMPRQHTDLAPRRAHARNANTNTKHDFPVGGVTKDSPPQPPIFPDVWEVFGGIFGRCLGIILGHIWEVFRGT